jgi:hypothetical protein
MAEKDPREYRGGVREPEDAKPDWADNEGIVPREIIDEPPSQEQDADPQALTSDVTGEVTDHDHTGEAIDQSGGDEADATKDESAESVTWHEDPTHAGRTGTGEA